MEIRDITSLSEWERNPRSIDAQAFKRLKEQLKMGQHSTLLIMPDGTVLGGNMRLRAMKQLAQEENIYHQAKCIVIDFIQEADGWCAVIDGETNRSKYFKTRDDAMMAYSLSHNDRAGFYDSEQLVNILPEYSIDWDMFSMDLSAPKTLKEQVERMGEEIHNDIMEKTGGKKDSVISCPSCGHQFKP